MAEESKSIQVQNQSLVSSEDSERTHDRPCFIPQTDIYETRDHILLNLDMPGVKAETINVTLEKNILTINAEAARVETPEGYRLVLNEYQIGDFERSFRINELIDREHIEAKYKDGVLHLALPKAEQAKSHKIAVQAG
ncbi:MAG TPA: Hsp20/alpha crystallin family protein [Anaerolineaceae bacterium]|nr:Hsp20/alpha crystallin family protein [Anaerolineaceae bacterium]HPN53163.1 Hsp20/alpha crystallin family protein [Anaerolineaceae bacterium]